MSQSVQPVPVAEETPAEVSRIFTFGYGHVDPNSGEDLAESCAVVTAASHETCRDIMFEAFGNRWAFDYASLEEATVPGSKLRIHVVIDDVTKVTTYPAAKFYRRPGVTA